MKTFALIFLLSTTHLFFCQLYEPFNFTGNLNANGWTTHSGTAGQIQADNLSSLNFTGLPTSIGNKINLVSGNNEDVNLAISGISGVGYLSFLINVPNLTGLSTTGDYFTGFAQTSGNNVTSYASRIFIKSNTGSTYFLGCLNGTGGIPASTPNYINTALTCGVTYFVVVKFNTLSTTTESSIFINPTPGQVEPNATVSHNIGTSLFSTFASVFLRQSGTSSAGTGNIILDEIRIGNSWASVTPAINAAPITNPIAPTISINGSSSICEGTSTTLSVLDNPGNTACHWSQLPSNLQYGLLGYWPFCGNADDVSGFANHGTVNGASLSTDRFGNANSAYSFNGTSSYIDVAHTASLNLTNAYTVEFWVNNLNNTGGWYSTVSKDNWFANQGFINYIAATNFASVNCAASNHATTTLPINTWVQIIVTYENGTLKVYKNGILVASENQSFSNSTSSLRFGARHQNDGSGIVNFFQGKLDDIAIWNRALTATEIQQVNTLGNATYVWTPGGATTPSITVSPASTTTYTCTASSNGISSSATSTVTVNPLPIANAGADSTITCNQYVNGYQLGWIPEAGNSYSWSPTTGLSNANIANPIANPSVTTTYTLTVTNSFGCTATDQATATVNTTTSAITVSPNVTICQGSSATLFHNPLPAGSYWVGGWQTWSQDTIVVTPTTVGQHTYTCYSANGCSSASVVVTVVASPILNPVQNQVICSGTPTQSIVFNGTTGSNYTWTAVINPGITGLPNTGVGNIPSYILYNNTSVPQLISIVVTPSLQQGNMTCQGSPEVFTITVLPFPIVMNPGNQVVCCQSNTSPIILVGGFNNNFWNATASSSLLTGYPTSGSSIIPSFIPLNTDSITHQIDFVITPISTYNNYSCIGQAETVSIFVLPCLTVDSVPNIERCNGEYLNEIVFSGNANSFNWTNSNINNGLAPTGIGNIPDMIVNNPGNTSISSQVTVSPYYTWQGMSCTGAAETFNLTIHPTPTIDAGNDVFLCNNTALSLSAIGSPNSTLIWNGNLPNGSIIYPTQSGFQTVEATYPNGCTTSDSIFVTILESSSSTVSINSCDSYTLNGQTYTSGGIYTQVVPNVAGCDSTITLDLTLNYSPSTPIVTIQNEVNLLTSNNTGVTYQWIQCSDLTAIAGQTNSSFNPTANGLYAVVATNSCGSDTSDCANVSTIGLNEIKPDAILVYPNPNNGEFMIEIPLDLLGQELSVSDINGRTIRIVKLNELINSINMAELARGTYWLRISNQKPIQMVKN